MLTSYFLAFFIAQSQINSQDLLTKIQNDSVDEIALVFGASVGAVALGLAVRSLVK